MSQSFSLLVPTAFHWLALSAILFAIGVYGLLSRRNAVAILMAVELMLNSAALNFVVFDRYFAPAGRVDGQIMALFVIATAAAEVVVGMAIFVALFRSRGTVDVNHMDTMKN